MKSENQHWVPKFLIRNFTDTDGRVFRLDLQTDEITKPPPRHAASAVGFNEFQIEGEAISFEDRLEKIETKAAPILRRIVSEHSTAGLTQEQRGRVADFMAAQSFRTEAFYQGLALPSREQFGKIFAQLWRSAFLVSGEIKRRHWVVMVINGDGEFYLGDNPVVLQLTENPSAGGQLGFDIEGVEAFLPLAPKCALYMPCVSVSTQIIQGYENAIEFNRTMTPEEMRNRQLPGKNENLLQLVQLVLGRDLALYNALTAGSAITAVPENVENLNYLQCAWSHAAIYSSRRDFTFARRVFTETPQYRETMKASVLERYPSTQR